MPYSSYARRHKRDATHGEVAETLEAFGWSVHDLSAAGGGAPDLLVGRQGVTDLVEVKSGPSGPYTPAQVKFRERWRGSDPVRLENRAQAEAWCRRTIRDRRR